MQVLGFFCINDKNGLISNVSKLFVRYIEQCGKYVDFVILVNRIEIINVIVWEKRDMGYRIFLR